MQDITDEVWFHLSGFSNSQNYRTWSAYSTMLLRCHYSQLKLVLGLRCPEGELLVQSSLMKLSILKDIEDAFLTHL
jgi:hypothetical protein